MKRIIFLFCLIQIGIISYAEKANKQLALSIAMDFMNKGREQRSRANSLRSSVNSSNIRIDEISLTGKSSLYMIRSNDQTVLMNTNTTIPEIIAYVDSRLDNISNLPKPFIDYLKYFEEYSIIHFDEEEPSNKTTYNKVNGKTASSNRIDPLLTDIDGNQVNWRQRKNNGGKNPLTGDYSLNTNNVYNKYMPSGQGYNNYDGHVLAGCGAVAMAQLMWYWQWPPALPINGHIHFYEWNKMPTDIYNSTSVEEVDQIASLLSHCAQAVDMSYIFSYSKNSHGSFCYSEDIANALVGCFEYSADKEICLKTTSAHNKHERKIIEHLKNGQPVLAEGVSLECGNVSGHHFVIDGYEYRDDDYWFHINWGWGVQTSSSYCFWCRICWFKDGTGAVYNWFKRFIYDICPNWIKYNSPLFINNKRLGYFHITNKEEVNLTNVSVPSISRGYVISGDYVYLGPGCRFEPGCEVYIGTQEMKAPWQRTRSVQKAQRRYPNIEMLAEDTIAQPLATEEAQSSYISYSSPTTITITSSEPIAIVRLYTIAGQYIKTLTPISHAGTTPNIYSPKGNYQTDIDVSFLTTGAYMIVAQTQNGLQIQNKFVKQ